MKNIYDIIRRPVITEKSTSLVEQGKYTFEVQVKANKFEIKEAIEKAFDVDVVSVNLINVRKKKRRVGHHSGYTAAVKKAIVTLKPGQTLDVFEV